ncbi:hypothetical protein AMJ85_09540 [candidate division BRC1 bacterium SM23_51]|nr:MAG: hypothetical protein AMJ85_09540 [candidate division BRC1 bacterium SM23_51]
MNFPLAVIIVVFAFGALVVLMALIAEIVKMKISQSKRGGSLSNNEAREIQEMHRELERLCNRVEALETILLDHAQRK